MKTTKLILLAASVAPAAMFGQAFSFQTVFPSGDVLTFEGSALASGSLLSYGTMAAAPTGDPLVDAGVYTELGSAVFDVNGNVSTGTIALTPGTVVYLWAFDGPAISFDSQYALFGGFTIPATGTLTATANGIATGTQGSIFIGGTSGAAPATNITLAAVPEPSTFALLGGVLALGFVMYRRRKA